ncbi:MAG: hypothetical protein NC212_08835 [Staphylococcus sp.]|nr:hypothetical protein [Staphylococcus sp.]
MTIPRSPRVMYGVSTLTIILGFIIPLLTLHLGFYPWKDEEYQILCISDYLNMPLAPLTMYIGHIWTLLTDSDTVLSYRILAYLCNCLSIAIPCVYLYRHVKSPCIVALVFLTLQLCMSLYGLFSFEWDTTAHLFLSLGATVAVSYLNRPTKQKIIISGLLASLAIFSRLPDIAVLPVVMILIAVSRRDLCSFATDLCLFLLSSAASSAIIILMIWGSPSLFLEAWSADNYITGHSSLYDVMFMQVWERYPISLRYFFMWGGVFSAIYFLNVTDAIIPKLRKLFIAFITLLIIAMLLVIRVTRAEITSYPIEVFLFTLALVVATAIHHHGDIRKSALFSLTLLGFALVSYVGSDCGLSKMLCMPLMPLALAPLLKSHSKSINDFYVMLTVVVALCYIPLRLKNPWTREWINRYESTYTEIPQLRGIAHSPEEVDRRTSIYRWARETESTGNRILFLGQDRYMFDYILGHREDNIDRYPLQRYHDDNNFDDVEDKLINIAGSFDYIYLGYEFDEAQRQKISAKLDNEGFSLYLSTPDYTIWKK